MTSLDLVNNAILDVSGGLGGQGGGQGVFGNGGSAGLTASGVVSLITSDLYVLGGSGISGEGGAGMTEGSGGNASAILASLTAVSNSSFDLEGGEAANDLGSGNGGTGGNAAMVVSGPVSVDGTQVLVKGGAGGNSSSANAGSGGDSGLFLGSAFTLTGVQGSSTWIVIGGEGGIGKGSSGGSAGITASGPLSLDASTIDLTGGNGDMGGGVALTLNSAFLNHFSDLRLTGGNGWSGTGGSVQVSIGALDLADSGSELSVQGGFGPANGSADVTIGALTGAGVLSISSSGQSGLQIASGDFAGVIGGDSGMEKTGPGALTLTGACTYAGPTTLTGGVLNVQGDDNLGDSGQLLFNGGTLQAGAGFATTQTASINAPLGTVDLNGNSVTWNGTIGGTGTLAVDNSAFLVSNRLYLNNPNTYSGERALPGVNFGYPAIRPWAPIPVP